jgi:hypothetical protein
LVRGVGADDDGDATRQSDGLGVCRPVGSHDEDLVAGVEQCGEGLEHGVLGAVGHQHVGRLDGEARVTGGLGGDRLPQLG